MREVIVPRLLAMLCVIAVFIPSFFMAGVGRALFPPLALAVAFSMISSYLLSSTLVPVLSVWLFRNRTARAEQKSGFLGRLQERYGRFAARVVRLRDVYLPKATQTRDTVDYAYRRGGVSLLDFLDAQRSYRETAAELTAVAISRFYIVFRCVG